MRMRGYAGMLSFLEHVKLIEIVPAKLGSKRNPSMPIDH